MNQKQTDQRSKGDPMNDLLLPPDVTDLHVTIKTCNQRDHAHRVPLIEVVTCKLFGLPVTIEHETGSRFYNVKLADESIVHATAEQVEAWVNKFIKDNR